MSRPDTGFVGWHRFDERFPWRPVCHGASPEMVLLKLLGSYHHGDRMVLAAGVDGNERQPSIRRRRF
jgi:hypothetical protein